MSLFYRFFSFTPVISLVLLQFSFGSTAHASSVTPESQIQSVAFLPTEHISNTIQPNFQLKNAQIIDQNETGFFLEELEEMNQLCDLKTVSCLTSVGQLLGADLIIQIWSDPAKNDVFRFIDISLKQEIHREIIPKKISDKAIYNRIKKTYDKMQARPEKHPDTPIQYNQKYSRKDAHLPHQQISQANTSLPLKHISAWSAVGVGSAANIIGGLFFFLHPAHSITLPNDAPQAFKMQLENSKQNKKEVAYALWASGATLTIAGMVQLLNQDTTE